MCVSGGASDYALVVVENTEEWDSLWSVICGFKRLDQIPKREREREEYILRESERLGEMVGSGHANCCVNEKWCVI